MRRILIALCVFGAMGNSFAAESPELKLREAAGASTTNLPAPLTLIDKSRGTAEPTNAEALATRAFLLGRTRNYDAAIRDLSAALKLEPDSPRLWQERGEFNFRAGHFKESVDDFDRVIAMNPAKAPHHWQRGLSLYYAGRFADGRRQFESHQTVNPNDVENAAWHFLCNARETSLTNARAHFLAPGKDARIPMQEIYEFYRGTRTADEVLVVATRATNELHVRDALFYAHLYLGLYYDVAGDKTKAREHMAQAAGDKNPEQYMGDVARVHLVQLNAAR